MEWFQFGKFLLDTLATATCCMHNFLFLHAERGMWWFPPNSKNPVTSSCYVGKPGQPMLPHQKTLLCSEGNWLTNLHYVFSLSRQRQRCVHNRWLAAQIAVLKRKKTPLYVCVRERRCQPSLERVVWITKKSFKIVVKSRILPRGSYDLNNVSYGTGSGKLSGLTLTWQQQQMQSRRREKEIMTRGNRQFLFLKRP